MLVYVRQEIMVEVTNSALVCLPNSTGKTTNVNLMVAQEEMSEDTTVNRLYPLDTSNVCTKFHGSVSMHAVVFESEPK